MDIDEIDELLNIKFNEKEEETCISIAFEFFV